MKKLIVRALLIGTLLTGQTSAQEPPAPRKLAPGVMTVIPPDRNVAETFSGPRELVEIVQGMDGIEWQPNFAPQSETLVELAKQVVFRRPVWHLEFAFKPLRMTYVDLPRPDGKLERKLIWYLVYKVKNTGYHMNPTAEEDQWGHKSYTSQPVNYTVRFFPQFVLECFGQKKAYLDRFLPAAVQRIQAIEDPNIQLYDKVSISKVDIPVSTGEIDRSVWGVATWENVDPRTDFFAVFVQGLTNAYRWEDPQGAFAKGDPPGTGRTYQYKTLQLNFWRPGDETREHQAEVQYGMPGIDDVQGQTIENEADLTKLYRAEKKGDYSWVFRT
jgi:hypothetical protein